MKIIFLDIDGVLNPTHYHNAMYKMWSASKGEIKSHDEFGQLFFDQNVKALLHIIDNTQANVVISSTWRIEGLKKMEEMFMYRGIHIPIIDVTPTIDDVETNGESEYYDSLGRGAEIASWIGRNEFKGDYVIIDDDDDMLREQQGRFVQTNPYYGLTMKDADKAIKILNK